MNITYHTGRSVFAKTLAYNFGLLSWAARLSSSWSHALIMIKPKTLKPRDVDSYSYLNVPRGKVEKPHTFRLGPGARRAATAQQALHAVWTLVGHIRSMWSALAAPCDRSHLNTRKLIDVLSVDAPLHAARSVNAPLILTSCYFAPEADRQSSSCRNDPTAVVRW